jgi:hypothetical protein
MPPLTPAWDGPCSNWTARRRPRRRADISNVVSTDAHSRLTIALNRRNGAAVGVAGPRGSGKTELARAFTELRPSNPKSRTIPLMMWAPVKYDAQTFLLRLLKELCISILATGAVTPGDDGLIFTSRSRRIAIAVGAAVVAAAGIALVTIKATSTKIGPEVPFGIGGLLIIGGAAIVAVMLRPRPPSCASCTPSCGARKLAAGRSSSPSMSWTR